MNPQITIMVDIDDVLCPLVKHWINMYKQQRVMSFKRGILDDSHDGALNPSMVTS